MARKIQRIEKEIVLKELLSSKAEIFLHYRDKRLRAILREYSTESITLEFVENESIKIKKDDWASLFFRFRDAPITCTLQFSERVLNAHLFHSPAVMYRDLSRKYERMQLGNRISVSIIVDGKKLSINFPTSTSYFNPETQNLGGSPPAISDLLRSFRERCASFSSESTTVLFRERKPSTIIERIIASSGKIVSLPLVNMQNCPSMDNKIAVINARNINWIAEEVGESAESLRLRIKNHVLAMRQKGIQQELYVPILFYEYVVGYLYLMRGANRREAFDCEHVELAYQFSCLFAHSLNSSGYFKTTQGKSRIGGSELIDVSATGLLFSYPDSAPYIDLYNEIDIELEIDGQVLPIRGQVMRKIHERAQDYVGLQFTSVSSETRASLMKILYGEDYAKDIEIL